MSAARPRTAQNTKDDDSAVSADLIDLVYALSVKGRYNPLIVFLVAAPVFLAQAPWWSLPVIVGLQLGGTLYANRLRARHAGLPADADRRPWARAYLRVTGICAASWGVAGVLWYVPGSIPHQALLALILAGAVTGGMVARAPYMPALGLFVLVAGGPFVIRLAASGELMPLIMAGLGLVYATSILGWGQGIRQAHRREIAARRANERLLAALETAREEAEHRAAEATRALHAAEAGERAKSEFLAMMSHEVRTPLNGIQGMAEVLQGTALDAGQKEFLGIIHDSAKSLALILDDILELSRMQGEGVAADLEEFDPRAVASDVARIVGPEAHRKGLQIRVETEGEIPRRVLGDSRRIRQVLVNLAGNSVKFTDAGEVAIRVSALANGSGRTFRFAVRDTGIGIDPESLDRVFETFVQGDQSTTRRHGGGGLGLALARRLVSVMGGTISVRSAPGEGSEFWFDLSLTDAPGYKGADAPPAYDTDMSCIHGLEARLGAEKAGEIVATYLDTAWKLAGVIRKAGADADSRALARAACDLRNAADRLGMTGLAARAGALERDVRAGRSDAAAKAAQWIETDLAAAHQALIEAYPAAMR